MLINSGEDSSKKSLRQTALDMLALREHSCFELRQKLLRKGFAQEDVEALIENFKTQGWLDDARFVESYVRARVNKGYGPYYITHALSERGVSSDEIESALTAYEEGWSDIIQTLYQKKFRNKEIKTWVEKAKVLRFFQQRGFALSSLRGIREADDEAIQI